MKDLFQKSKTRSTKKLNIYTALWDGFIYPFRSIELIHIYIFSLIYSMLSIVILVFLLFGIFHLFSVLNEIFINPAVNSIIIYSAVFIFYCSYLIFFAPFYGYFTTVIQNSLKNNDKLPRF
jgi:hypothetical protein